MYRTFNQCCWKSSCSALKSDYLYDISIITDSPVSGICFPNETLQPSSHLKAMCKRCKINPEWTFSIPWDVALGSLSRSPQKRAVLPGAGLCIPMTDGEPLPYSQAEGSGLNMKLLMVGMNRTLQIPVSFPRLEGWRDCDLIMKISPIWRKSFLGFHYNF